ncbi:hypothetical protein HDU86_006108 [Geranomyces michiganensis]|nr:hypothetical protein HDU86_006108 [Geranomyces michiganensis]
MDVEGCERVYNYLIALILRAYRSTRRNSHVDLSALDGSEQKEEEEDVDQGDEEEDPDVDPTVVATVIFLQLNQHPEKGILI